MKSLRPVPPVPHAAVLRRWSLIDGDDLHSLRSGLGRELGDRGFVDQRLWERMTLAVTELASNALRHGSPPVEVGLLRAPGCLIIEVSDRGLAAAPVLPAVSRTLEGGRGLLIVGSLADDLGWYAGAEVKSVWASFMAEPIARPGAD